jgi:hypothetical protein
LTTDHNISINWEIYTQDPKLAHFECSQKLKFAVWELMECLGEEMGRDNPTDTITLVCKTVDESFDGGFDDEFAESKGGFEDE